MQNSFNLALLAPEIILAVVALAVLIIDASGKSETRRLTFGLSIATLLLLTVVSAVQWNNGAQGEAFSGLFVTDSLSHFLKILSYIAVAVTLIYGRSYVEQRDMVARGGEYYTLALLALLGQMVMISAGNLITIYLGLELMSLALYAMVALRRDDVQATEAAMKYFVLGSLASGVLLYGMSMIYGATGDLSLEGISLAISTGNLERLPLVFGVVFIVSGLAFKLAAAPFHTAVTRVVGAAPKIAAFAIALRLLVDGLHGLAMDWQPMLLVLAVASLVIGNLAAIAQSNFKRMLAYSTISHMGFVFLGMMAGVVDGTTEGAGTAYGASLFYVIIYVLTTLSTFGLIRLLSRKGFECENLTDLKGLNRRNPVLAGILLLSMFSLAGIPPLAGFYAKLVVLQALISAGYVWVAVVAVIFSLIGAFYYLRVVKMAYFDEPEGEAIPGGSGALANGVMSVNGLLIIGLGILPGGLMALCISVIENSLSF